MENAWKTVEYLKNAWKMLKKGLKAWQMLKKGLKTWKMLRLKGMGSEKIFACWKMYLLGRKIVFWLKNRVLGFFCFALWEKEV